MLKTRVTQKLGIEYPIIAAPMLWISGAEMVAAVSNAGGLGIMASLSFHTQDKLRDEIRKTRQLTDKPFAVNVTLMPTARQIKYEDYFATAISEGVKIIETSGRSPEPYMAMLKSAGVTTMHRATSVRHLQTAERAGVDILTVLGFEAAGHIGLEDVTNLVKIPIAASTIKAPIVAAGGIADARGMVAALALGADAVMMGTRFVVSQECPIHPAIKELMVKANESDTMLIQRSIRNPQRTIRTEYAEKILAMEEKGATLEQLLPLISGEKVRQSYASGDVNASTLASGQIVGLLRDVPSVKDIIDGIISDSGEIMKRLNTIGLGGKK